jgi:hypothetical protein
VQLFEPMIIKLGLESTLVTYRFFSKIGLPALSSSGGLVLFLFGLIPADVEIGEEESGCKLGGKLRSSA